MWDDWIGQLALQGVDPRLWDLNQLCAAFEANVRANCKDESEWLRERGKLYAPPRGLAKPGPQGRPRVAAMDATSVSALLAGMAAEDAMYGTK